MNELGNRAAYLAREAVTRAMGARESWHSDGQLDYDMFADLVADEIEAVFRSILTR